MINPENEFVKALINIVIPAALAGAVVQIATRMLKRDITFIGAILTLIIAGCFSIPVGMYFYYNSTPVTCAAITSFTGMFSRDLAKWIVYGAKIDKGLNTIWNAIIDWIVKKFK
ncbi:MAG: hypothetical protein GY928_18205 [Colwellia sp.]|nr:hypothetical protein [Colwellia sp.]